MAKEIDRWIPTGYSKYHEDENCVVYADLAHLCAIAYHGRSGRHDWHHSYRSRESLDCAVSSYATAWKRHAELKAEQRARGRELSPQAAAAVAIRAELKAAFPGVKFQVRSSSFSMGEDVRVSWLDGPRLSEVNAIIGRYQYGHVDCMQDLYEDDNVQSDIPQAKYVSAQRELSIARAQELAAQYAAARGCTINVIEKGSYWTADWASPSDEAMHNYHSPRCELVNFEEDQAREAQAASVCLAS